MNIQTLNTMEVNVKSLQYMKNMKMKVEKVEKENKEFNLIIWMNGRSLQNISNKP